MLLKSQFRKLCIYKFAFFIPLCFLILLACTINYFDDTLKLKERQVMLFFGIFAFVMLIGLAIDLIRTYRVQLDNEKITVQNLIGSKRELYYYKDITEIKILKNNQPSGRGVPTSDTYLSLAYYMVDGRSFEITPDLYENYRELVYAIKDYIPHLEHP